MWIYIRGKFSSVRWLCFRRVAFWIYRIPKLLLCVVMGGIVCCFGATNSRILVIWYAWRHLIEEIERVIYICLAVGICWTTYIPIENVKMSETKVNKFVFGVTWEFARRCPPPSRDKHLRQVWYFLAHCISFTCVRFASLSFVGVARFCVCVTALSH